jgi:hypothetical protein
MPDASSWNPNHLGVWISKGVGTRGAITLRHPGYPYVTSSATAEPDKLRSIAVDYLGKSVARLGLPSDLFVTGTADFKSRPSGFQLTWLPVGSGARDSFRFVRYRDPQARTGPIDQTLVLLAVQSRVANDPAKAVWSRHGLRVVAQVSRANSGQPHKIRVTSSACSIGLAEALAGNPAIVHQYPDFANFSVGELKHAVGSRVLAAAGLSAGAFVLDGLRIVDADAQHALFELYVNVPRPAAPRQAPAYALSARVSVPKNAPLSGARVLSVAKSPWIAHASTLLFQQDPPSASGKVLECRPNRSGAKLDPYRKSTSLDGAADSAGKIDLREDLGNFEIRESCLIDAGADGTRGKVADLADNKGARTNTFAAFSAYTRARGFFDRMRSYGIAPADYFRAASRPLRVRYREGMLRGPGKDGRTVNAQVDFDPPPLGVEEAGGAPQPLQVRFGLADLQRSASRREPLGLAADPRWSWHEFGHVLLAASTGALELPFVHSVGDALAAIACDPESQLVSNARLRGATYPWVYLNRRHDRSVFLGWSWCGTHHRQAEMPIVSCNCRHKGYLSEQILSSTLFRLYLALGGETLLPSGKPDVPARQAAADYAIYLVMRAVALLGSASALPAQTPDQFVTALIEADIGSWPANRAAPLPLEFGGCAHKLVRWSFEAQGLYASNDWDAVVNAPGNPPEVDIYIDNHRPDADGAHKRGGYMPVSLDWHGAPGAPGTPCTNDWRARDDAMEIQKSGSKHELKVQVRNRGTQDADQVKVRAWYTEWTGAPPDWNDVRWIALTPSPSSAKKVPAQGKKKFGPFNGLPAQRKLYLVLAEASCESDCAITDTAADLPCASSATPTLRLVAGDNNLGLRFFDNR